MPEETHPHRRQRPRNPTLRKMTHARRACANLESAAHLLSINRTRWRLSSKNSNLLAFLLLYNLSSAMQAFKTGPTFHACRAFSTKRTDSRLRSDYDQKETLLHATYPHMVCGNLNYIPEQRSNVHKSCGMKDGTLFLRKVRVKAITEGNLSVGSAHFLQCSTVGSSNPA